MTTDLLTITRKYFANYKGLSKACWHGIILSLVEATLIGVYSFLPLYFINELKFSISQAGIIISFYGIGAIFGGYISGKLSDAYSSSRISIASLLVQSLVFFLLTQIHTFSLLSITLLLMGIASYSFLTAIQLWVLEECRDIEESKLKAINILSSASNLGGAFSAIIVGILINYGFHRIFYLVGILLLFSAVHFSLLVRNETQVRKTVDFEPETPSNIKAVSPKKINPIVWLILGCLFLVGLIIFQSNTTFPIYVQTKYPHLGLKGVSILFTINCLLVVFLQTPMVNMFINFNKVFIVGLGALLLGFGMLMLTFSINFVLAIFAYAIHTVGEMLFFSVAQLVCYESVEVSKKGYIMGLYRMIYAGSRVIAPAAGGYIYQQWGGNILWYLCGIIGLLCFEACNYNKAKFGF